MQALEARVAVQALSSSQDLVRLTRDALVDLSARGQAQRLQVAAALAELQASLGTYWPRITALADGSSGQSSNNLNAPVGTNPLGFGPNFQAGGLLALETGVAQHTELLASLEKAGLRGAEGRSDLRGRPRFVLVRR